MASSSPPKALFWGTPSSSSPAPINLPTSGHTYDYESEEDSGEYSDDEGMEAPSGSLPLHQGGDFYDASPKKYEVVRGGDDKENVTNGQYGISLDGIVGEAEGYDATKDDDYGDEGGEYDDEYDDDDEKVRKVTTPRMDPNFYQGVETLLSRPPPKFGRPSLSTKSAKETDAILRKNKQALRSLESNVKSAPLRTSNVKSKIDTGGKKKSRKNSGSQSVQQAINPDLLAEAFQYAERLSTMEALSDMPDGDSDAAKVALLTSKSGGTFAGNPLELARKMRQSTGKTFTNPNVNGRSMNAPGAAYGSMQRSSSSGGESRSKTGSKEKKGLKVKNQQRKKQSMNYGDDPNSANSRARDMEESLRQLSSGMGVEKLRRELEESKKNMEKSSGFLKDAAGEFLQGKFK
ncbi:hypothetical protein TL16_g10847 [Triparma laevis f. inornata]|uniref:Uncharacterized protein n=1 Tax=Triparma laevis f. inornata TaxID=1714386 RepID=A0A9W7ENQ4_9STRA|nr:hypothetical protein TL16_g10847 [Triparma laevis f. inornata]